MKSKWGPDLPGQLGRRLVSDRAVQCSRYESRLCVCVEGGEGGGVGTGWFLLTKQSWAHF